jgi:hypothetical protein
MNELKGYVNESPGNCAKEMCTREKLDNICAIINECEGITGCINGRLYNPIPCNPVTDDGPCDTIEAKLKTLYSTAINLCDSLKYINERL